MSETDVIDLPLPDEAARARIVSDLGTNLLVEAGAGSGKTTALVARMVALVRTGEAEVSEIAAVTFTRKAAGELRERFQMAIEGALREERASSHLDDLALERLQVALDTIDRAFIGTIHSFCARLLRERPLEVGLDPGFRELPVEDRQGLRKRFWQAYLERLARDADPLMEDLARSGVGPATLYGLFGRLVENPDVHFPTELEEPPTSAEVAEVRGELEGIVDMGWELMQDRPVPKRDSLFHKIRKLHFEREITGWKEEADLFAAIAELCKSGESGHRTTLRNWRSNEMAKQLRDRADAFGVGDTAARALLDRWYARRYALALRLCRGAVAEFEAHRHRIGLLDFQDLLVLSARLLRSRPDVRRQLGRRYRRLLVDEFQDTDPLQAEIMLLLSSEPNEQGEDAPQEGELRSGEGWSDREDDAAWREAEPRPGALFVVGDPKQSIYRFRRADIQLYGFVRERFRAFGDVVSLSTNFRSRPPIGDIVNEVFSGGGFFPESSTAEQAAFERLDTRPPEAPVPEEGVFHYVIAPERTTKEGAAEDDAERLAAWIRARVDTGERRPEDFLILTRDRGQIATYARAIEARSLPLSVTGAGVGVEHEIRELQLLLECMIDPTNPVRVVAALVGLFFGLDYERLVSHRLEGGAFDVITPGERGEAEVLDALRRLSTWWRRSTVEPADVFVGRLVSELGLLPYAAAGDLGTLRAGALLYALEAVRSSALAGDASLPGALAALEAALDLREAEAPLEPGRPDTVRLMNLHQAKGLEGTVVVLANPTDASRRAPDIHLTRSEDGTPVGYLRVSAGVGHGQRDVARPAGWADRERAERSFEEAEEVRLLYVAVTRAREELWVARWPGGRGSSAWSPLHDWLDENADRIELDRPEADEVERLEVPSETLRGEAVEARALRLAGGERTYVHATVTELTKRAPERGAVGERPSEGNGTARTGFRGFSWGSAVHGALAAAASEPRDEELLATCRNLLVEHRRPLDDHGEPRELRELIELVRTVRGSEIWSRALEAERVLVEVSFAVPGIGTEVHDVAERPEPPGERAPERPQLDLFGLSTSTPASETAQLAGGRAAGRPDGAAGPEGAEAPGPSAGGPTPERTALEGVIDLAFREPDGWVIADYKTDVGTDPDFSRREEAYRRQVELYAEAWAELTGESVKERVLFFTAQDRVERW